MPDRDTGSRSAELFPFRAEAVNIDMLEQPDITDLEKRVYSLALESIANKKPLVYSLYKFLDLWRIEEVSHQARFMEGFTMAFVAATVFSDRDIPDFDPKILSTYFQENNQQGVSINEWHGQKTQELSSGPSADPVFLEFIADYVEHVERVEVGQGDFSDEYIGLDFHDELAIKIGFLAAHDITEYHKRAVDFNSQFGPLLI